MDYLGFPIAFFLIFLFPLSCVINYSQYWDGYSTICWLDTCIHLCEPWVNTSEFGKFICSLSFNLCFLAICNGPLYSIFIFFGLFFWVKWYGSAMFTILLMASIRLHFIFFMGSLWFLQAFLWLSISMAHCLAWAWTFNGS